MVTPEGSWPQRPQATITSQTTHHQATIRAEINPRGNWELDAVCN